MTKGGKKEYKILGLFTSPQRGRKVESALLLNASFEPLRVVSWKRAITLVTLGKVEVIEEYDREVRSVSFTIRLPSIIRLIRYVRRRKSGVKFSRQNIYARDKNHCQYCGKKLSSEELTYDHVTPKSAGGKTEWSNIVTCCMDCNRKKGGRTPAEAGMKLLRKPKKPEWLPILRITINIKKTPESWLDYLYWNVELEA